MCFGFEFKFVPPSAPQPRSTISIHPSSFRHSSEHPSIHPSMGVQTSTIIITPPCRACCQTAKAMDDADKT